MAEVTVTTEIAAPVGRVFDTLTDFANAPEVIRGITAMEVLTEGPVGAGTRIRETRVMFGKSATEEMEVAEFDRPHYYVLACENRGCRYRTEVRCHATENGTRIDMVFSAEPLNTIARMMAFMMKPMLKSCAKAMENDLNDVRDALESGSVARGWNE